MRQTLMVLALLGLAVPSSAQEESGSKCKKCGNEKYGTTVSWVGSASEAAKKAKEQEKLVFVLHVSGYFEDPKFT